MATERMERRLTAILAADVAGYSQLMGADEEGTLAELKSHRTALLDPKIDEYCGRIVKSTGDGILAEFGSVVDALRCAVEIQRGMSERNTHVPEAKRIEFRIGINVGDIIVEGGDIFGEGVNVAARLEALAERGGICVSSRVHEDVEGKLDLVFEDMGEQKLKNIARSVWVYRVRLNRISATPVPALPDKPSISVLPFQNMSGDPEQEYFADGIVEEITTALSRMSWLFVIARNSSFTYRGRTVDVKQIGRELGVRYVLEGSVRKAANRVRISAQLIDALTATHLWADRFEGNLENIFDLQDQITQSVVGAIAPKLEQAEIDRAKRKPTESLNAYDYYLRALAYFHQYSREGTDQALPLFYKAIELDPAFSSAYGMAAWCYARRKGNRWVADDVKDRSEAARLAYRAAALGKDDAIALSSSGFALSIAVGKPDEAIALIERALVINPNLVSAWVFSGWTRLLLGDADLAIERFRHSMRLSPLDPLLYLPQSGLGLAYFLLGRYDDASSWARNALRQKPRFHPSLRVLAASDALAGRLEDAQNAMAQLREIDPALRVSDLAGLLPFWRSSALDKYVEGLRKAGLPE
jgi:TolB-like protein/class 3 adenylate cyclase